MLFSLIPYLFFSIYSYLNEKSLLILTIFLVLGILSLLYYLFFNKNKDLSKVDFWVMTAISGIIVFIFTIYIYKSFNSTNITMPFILIASVPVIYNIMGIANFISLENKKGIMGYIVGIIAAPIITLFIFNIFMGSNFESIQMISVISMYYAIIFMIIHICFVLLSSKKIDIEDETYSRTHQIVTCILGLFLPLIGLMINLTYVIYDFSSPIFFIIALINGALLLIPIPKDQNLRLFLFYLKSVGYGFILYFFIVFIPLMPIGLLLIVFVVGILVFAPSLITFWQGRILLKDWKALRSNFNNLLVIAVFFIGVFTLPLVLLTFMYSDRPNLTNAIEYIHENGLEKRSVNLSALERSLNFIEDSYLFSGRRTNFLDLDMGFQEGSMPIISNVYSKIVLRGGTLSQNSLNGLKSIFFDENIPDDRNPWTPNNNVQLYDYKVETTYDPTISAYRSWINLQIKNNYENGWTEYKTEFTLPEGAFISDYYLYVNSEKKEGILADDRAATFVYNKIVSRSLDPGILHYINENTIELKVFPLAELEIRKTGFEVIHKSSLDLVIDGKTMNLKGDDGFSELNAGNVRLLSSKFIDDLPLIDRSPEYNFVIDCSKNSDVEFLKKQVLNYAKEFNIEHANVYFASYRVTRSNSNDFNDVTFKKEGGFNLNLAIKNILGNTDAKRFPIIIAVTENMPNSVFYENTKSYLFPESLYYYGLNYDFTLTPYSFVNSKKQGKVKEPIITAAVSYDGTAVKKDGKDHLVLFEDKKDDLGQNQYENALILYGQNNDDKDVISNVRDSFRSNVLTKNTAFIVVETEEQEKELLSYQEKLFSSENIDETPTQNLSEPPFFILIIIVVLFGILKKWHFKKVND